MSTNPTPDQRRAWMAQWRSAAPELARIRADEFRTANLAVVAQQLDALCIQSIRTTPPPPTSGLIEQQRLFRRARGR